MKSLFRLAAALLSAALLAAVRKSRRLYVARGSMTRRELLCTETMTWVQPQRRSDNNHEGIPIILADRPSARAVTSVTPSRNCSDGCVLPGG